MKIASKSTDDKTYIIAEIGNNHEGSFKTAKRMILEAAKTGVDAVKFQTFKAEKYVSGKNKQRFEMLRSFELSYKEFLKLNLIAKDSGLDFISTPFDLQSAEFLLEFADAIKISSGDNTFYPLIDTVSKSDLPLIISTGILNIDEIIELERLIKKTKKKDNYVTELAFLHCVTAYPVEPKFANLNAIKSLKRKLKSTVGYSDHTLGVYAAISSISLGARIIEKHFTLDKYYSKFRDHQLSADFIEMSELVKSIRLTESMLGDGKKLSQPPENEIKQAVRRSIIAVKNLSKGHVIEASDLSWVRPAGGLEPGRENEVLGKRLTKNIKKGTLIKIKDLSN